MTRILELSLKIEGQIFYVFAQATWNNESRFIYIRVSIEYMRGIQSVHQIYATIKADVWEIYNFTCHNRNWWILKWMMKLFILTWKIKENKRCGLSSIMSGNCEYRCLNDVWMCSQQSVTPHPTVNDYEWLSSTGLSIFKIENINWERALNSQQRSLDMELETRAISSNASEIPWRLATIDLLGIIQHSCYKYQCWTCR